VRETWDITQESALTRAIVRRDANAARKNMTATLEKIERIVTT
jgi:hypothetical protein